MARRPDIVGFDSQRPTARSRMGAHIVDERRRSWPDRRPLRVETLERQPLQLIVKMRDPIFSGPKQKRGTEVAAQWEEQWLPSLRKFAGACRIVPPFSDSTIDYIRLSMKSGQTSHGADDPATALLSFVQIDYEDPNQLPKILRSLRSCGDAEFVYSPQSLFLTKVLLPDGQEMSCQKTPIPKPLYFSPALVGMSVEKVWQLPGGRGQGQNLVDIEYAWNVNHVELAGKQIDLIYGFNNTNNISEMGHGTSMLCTACGANKNATVGIASDVVNVKLAGIGDEFGVGDVHQAVIAATQSMPFGGVVLIEVGEVPVEVGPLVFHSIRLATSKGLVVVEPTGNLNYDLDTKFFTINPTLDQCALINNKWWCPPPKRVSLILGSPSYQGDSGAILVAPGSYGGPKGTTPVSYSDTPYGQRVDCYVAADQHTSCGKVGNADYVCQEGGGSSTASAVIAGCALIVQGIAEAHLGTPLPPLTVRALLRKFGQKNADFESKPIGVMPDLGKIADVIIKNAKNL